MAKQGTPQPTGANRRAQLKAQQEAAAKTKRLNRIIIGVVSVLAVALVAVFVVVLVMQFSNSSSAGNAVPPNATQDRNGIAAYKDKAKSGAPKVEVFFDYQCGGCASFEIAFGAELTKLARAGDIELVYRPMVFLDANHGNDASKRTATAAACADFRGKFNEYHTALFPLQQTGYPDDLLENTIPQQVGITGQDLTEFQKCYRERQTLNFVKGTDEQASRAGVQSTPTVWVNGKQMNMELLDANNAAGIKAIIDSTAAAAR